MRAGAITLLVSLLASCGGGDAPPLSELQLRDALSATPEAIAELPESARRALADRFETARKLPQPDEPAAPSANAAAEVQSVDSARSARGADALIVAYDKNAALRVHTSVHTSAADDAGTPLPALEGPPPGSTADEENRALGGRAGAVVEDLLRATGAQHVVRVTQWPIAAVAVGDTVYVNAAWLVALAANENGAPQRPVLQPAALHGNPYRTYKTLAACTNDVSTRCATCVASGADCDETATLTGFGSGRAECEWLVADSKRVAQLCALALMSISSVARCVVERSGCSIPGGTTNNQESLAATTLFLSQPACIGALNVCLSGSTSTSVAPDAGESTSTAPRSTEGCQDPFSACSSSLKGCNDACQSGSCSGQKGDSCSGSKCSSCDNKGDSCGGCSKSSDSGSSSSSSSGSDSSSSCGKNCNKCDVAQPANPVEPFVPPAMLAAPLVYLLLRARRRAR